MIRREETTYETEVEVKRNGVCASSLNVFGSRYGTVLDNKIVMNPWIS